MSVIQNLQLTPVNAFQNHNYRVPNYQREYVWEDKNVEALLDDVAEQMERDKNSQYFIGMVVVAPTSSSKTAPLDVIDGQQRLTTLFLLMLAIQQRVADMKDAATADALKGVISSASFVGGKATVRPKLVPFYEGGEETFEELLRQPGDTNAVRVSLTSKGVALAGSTHRLLSAYECINAYLTEHLQKPEQLRLFFDYLSNNVQFIQISAELGQALKMFETINERGVSLNAMDLLKNLLFVEVNERDYEKLKGKWEKITKPLDKAKLKPLRFLRYFIMANYPIGQDVVREDQIYEWFTTPSNIDATGYKKDPMKFVQELVVSAQWYVNVNAKKRPDGTDCRPLERLRAMTGAAFSLHNVILLAAGNLTHEAFDHLVEQLESYLFYVLYTGTPSKELEKQYAVQALEMRTIAGMPDGPKKLVTVDAFVQTHWQSFMNANARKLDAALISYSNGTTQRKFRTKYFLARLSQVADAAFQGVAAGYALDHYDELHIEHILPDTPNKEYDKIWDADAMNAALPYVQAKESLGNLMLLEAPININAGNDYYDQKRPKYQNSLIYLTKALVELTVVGRNTQPDRFNKHLRTFPTWNAASITDRQRMLAELAAIVWRTRPFGSPLTF